MGPGRGAAPLLAGGRDDLPGDDIKASAPKNALRPLLRELLGLTDARGRSVYLSDGGHFENLGLYEMVRRRCRFIVVSDPGCDPGATFADLGNALRKIKIDLGVDITIDTVDIASRAEWQREKSNFYALGTVHYSEGEGKLLYVKPSCHHAIPTDVRAYALASKTFPHESTADQWFSESQFESYRSLGSSLVERLGAQGARGPERYGTGRLAAFFQKVEEQVAEAKKGRGREQVRGGLERPEPLRAADGTSEIKDAAAGPAERDGASRLSAPSSVHDRLTSGDAGAGMTGMSAGT